MTFNVITITCIVLIITRLIYQYKKNIGIAWYIEPVLGFFILLHLVIIMLVANGSNIKSIDRENTQPNYTIAIDISESMKADRKSGWDWDIHTRWDLANQYAKDMIQWLLNHNPYSRINIVVFWGRSFEVVSPTNKREELINGVNQISPNMVNRQQDGYDGSDISQVLLLSETLVKLHKNEWSDEHKTLIITDGDHNRWMDVYEVMQYIKHPIFIIPIGSSSWEIFTKNSIPERKIDGSPVMLTTNIQLLNDIAQRTGWMVWDNTVAMIDALRHSKQETNNLLWWDWAYTLLIMSSIVLLIVYFGVLGAQWHMNRYLILWTVFLAIFLFWWLSALWEINKAEPTTTSDANSPVFVIDRNKNRDTSIQDIQQYIIRNKNENIILKYRDKTTQTIYSWKADTSDLQALLNLIQSLGASDAIGREVSNKNHEQIMEIKPEQNTIPIERIGLISTMIASLCMLISPLWIFQISRRKEQW